MSHVWMKIVKVFILQFLSVSQENTLSKLIKLLTELTLEKNFKHLDTQEAK